MDIKFDEYLARGTDKILEIFSSTDISDEEKEVIVSSFTEELMKNIGDTSKLQDYEYAIYSASLKFLDEQISGIISNAQASYNEYESAIKYCARAKDMIQIFSLKKWSIPKLGNNDIDKWEQILCARQESTSISSKIAEEDRRIDEQLRIAQNELSVKACDTVMALLDELANDLEVCKQKKVSVPSVKNKDTKKKSKKVAEIRKVAEQKESLHRSMYDVDLQIYNIISMPKSSREQWQEVITLCQKQTALISDCNKKQWPMPELRCDDANELIMKYRHYSHMNVLDKSISSNRALLTTGKQYKTFFGNCTQLANCIDTCTQNNWHIPDLIITDPLGLSAEVREEKKKKDRVKKIKQNIVFVAVGILAVIISVIFCVVKYREGKVQIPFDSDYTNGEKLSLIYDELDDAGFENIKKVSDTSGWLDSDEVISVSIDNQDSYNKDAYKKPDVSVVITYSSSGRIYATDLLNGWKDTEYTEVVEKLKQAGFKNVIVNEVDTAEKDLDNLTASIELNGISYTNEHCYLPADAPIVVEYYRLKITIGNKTSYFTENKTGNYSSIVSSLKSMGFTNITLYRNNDLFNGWMTKEGSIESITINGNDSFKSTDSFYYNAPIVIIVNTFKNKGCEDITLVAD